MTAAAWPSDDPRLAEILDIIATETGVARDQLQPAATIASLDIASLDLVQAVFAIETRFDVEIPVLGDQADGEFATVGDLVRHTMTSVQAKPGQAKPGQDLPG